MTALCCLETPKISAYCEERERGRAVNIALFHTYRAPNTGTLPLEARGAPGTVGQHKSG
jgi:hypothetical protein